MPYNYLYYSLVTIRAIKSSVERAVWWIVAVIMELEAAFIT